jgi:GntR family transcriptional regulator, vanillate catabolism transcriptional regulator
MQNGGMVKEMAAENILEFENGMQNAVDDEASSAESQLERATEALRDLVLRGTFRIDVKLPEARVAELIGVSRTPARLAMAALERDGLLMRLPRRGFRVRSFSLDEVVEAIEVRGELEAIAARSAAERGLGEDHRARMEACIARAEEILAEKTLDAARRRDWCAMNSEFHAALVEASGMRPLSAAYRQVNLVPLASPRDTIFNVAEPELLHRQLTAAHEDHIRILRTLGDRHSTRAAALVREHAYRSGENKRRNFPHIDMRTMVMETPGIALVRADRGS